jgi:hypothetical protein
MLMFVDRLMLSLTENTTIYILNALEIIHQHRGGKGVSVHSSSKESIVANP